MMISLLELHCKKSWIMVNSKSHCYFIMHVQSTDRRGDWSSWHFSTENKRRDCYRSIMRDWRLRISNKKIQEAVIQSIKFNWFLFFWIGLLNGEIYGAIVLCFILMWFVGIQGIQDHISHIGETVFFFLLLTVNFCWFCWLTLKWRLFIATCFARMFHNPLEVLENSDWEFTWISQKLLTIH